MSCFYVGAIATVACGLALFVLGVSGPLQDRRRYGRDG